MPSNVENSLYLVTGNKHKVEVAHHALSQYGYAVQQLPLETPEIQAASVEDVARYSVKYAADKTEKAVLKGDFGMHIEILNGFPGPFLKFINEWLAAELFIRLYEQSNNRRAYFVDALGYCEPGKDPVCFVTKTEGSLLDSPRGNNGNMVDSLFVPDGYQKTIAELSQEETLQLWNNDRFRQLAEYLNSLK